MRLNPQMSFLKKYGLLIPLQNLILTTLNTSFQSSHEIKNQLQGTSTLQQLQSLLKNYHSSGFREPASFIGAVSSFLSKRGVIQHSMKTCSVKNAKDDAFKINKGEL